MTLKTIALAAIALPVLFGQTDWPGYSKDSTGDRYSPLTQINTKNVTRLKRAWTYGIDTTSPPSAPGARGGVATTEAVPIMVGGVIYTPTPNHTIVALEPETGKELWKYDLGRVGAPLRGVTYWAGDADNPPEVMAGTSDGHLIAINAKTGKLKPRVRQGRLGQFAGRRGGQVSERSLSYELAGSDLQEHHHYGSTGPGGESRRSRDGCAGMGPADWQAALELPHFAAPGRSGL